MTATVPNSTRPVGKADLAGLPPRGLAWHTSDRVCALCDHERHLAHLVKLGNQWFAFDGTRPSAQEDGFCCLGSFAGRAAAMAAAERETFAVDHRQAFCASAGGRSDK